MASTQPIPSLSIILVSWNVREWLRRALHSIQEELARSGPWNAAIWVVDNASQDGTVDMVREEFPHVHLIPLPENVGFGAANNIALFAQGLLPGQSPPHLYSRSRPLVQEHPEWQHPFRPDAVLFLNPDTEVTPGAIRALWDGLFAHPRTGMVGPRLVYGDGVHQPSAFRFPGLIQTFLDFFPLHPRIYASRLNGRYGHVLYRGTAPFPVDFVLGAAMLVRREVIETVGGFDEAYWLYCEEMDWARRIRNAGWEIRVIPTATIVHHEGRSSRQFRERAFVALWESRLRYFRRYHGPLFNRLLRLIIRWGLEKEKMRAQHLPQPEREARLQAYEQVRRMLEEENAGSVPETQ
ncbi:MAG: glycosyltransferase [Chloroflexi bacterium]|nr:glycosyltransferase [Chloroflexota bacterium]